MQDQAGFTVPMPPVTTQFGGPDGLPANGDVRLVRPVVGEPTVGITRIEEPLPPMVAPAPLSEAAPLPWTDEPPAPEAAAAPEEPAPPQEPVNWEAPVTWQEPVAWEAAESPAGAGDDLMPWEEADDEGTAEPAFEADVFETEATLAALSQLSPPGDREFPLDAFIIPEHTSRMPTGVDEAPPAEAASHKPVTDLADRLEKLSHRMRMEDAEVLLSRLASGDKLDAMLAGLLAGFLAGNK